MAGIVQNSRSRDNVPSRFHKKKFSKDSPTGFELLKILPLDIAGFSCNQQHRLSLEQNKNYSWRKISIAITKVILYFNAPQPHNATDFEYGVL